MRKVYEYRNKAQAELVVVSPSGKTRYKFKFTGGVMDPKNKIHAKHTTDNPIMQSVLENSEYFNKVIFLVATFGSAAAAQAPALVKPSVKAPAPVKETAPEAGKGKAKEGAKGVAGKGKGAKPAEAPAEEPVQDADTEVAVFEDVTTLAQAASILVSYDVEGNDLMTVEGVLKAAKEKGILFPNLK